MEKLTIPTSKQLCSALLVLATAGPHIARHFTNRQIPKGQQPPKALITWLRKNTASAGRLAQWCGAEKNAAGYAMMQRIARGLPATATAAGAPTGKGRGKPKVQTAAGATS